MSNLPKIASGPHMAGYVSLSKEVHDAATPKPAISAYFDQLQAAGAPLHGSVLLPPAAPYTDPLVRYDLPDSGTPYGAPNVEEV